MSPYCLGESGWLPFLGLQPLLGRAVIKQIISKRPNLMHGDSVAAQNYYMSAATEMCSGYLC